MARGENTASYLRMLGEPAAWTPAAGAPVSLHALYQAPGSAVLDSEVIATQPSALLRAADVPGIKRGDALAINGGSYTVRESMSLDDGVFLLVELKA